ncbi:hypothetical protein L207DRAFT_107256 [Hyaloscypha variabilis F]|uniref:Uncharacterized protein n=1 Tax=Hyaloscypha variabilis (strain UAMH 11265 / GT02V1 / F) TaxID=1149755 RepID=A0A2J6R9E6_HYAVF|nr:hypothetical protein L207DRAFT_107256 [Hyaloscypha variabilis F]
MQTQPQSMPSSPRMQASKHITAITNTALLPAQSSSNPPLLITAPRSSEASPLHGKPRIPSHPTPSPSSASTPRLRILSSPLQRQSPALVSCHRIPQVHLIGFQTSITLVDLPHLSLRPFIFGVFSCVLSLCQSPRTSCLGLGRWNELSRRYCRYP